MSNEEDLVSLSQPLLQGEKKPKKPTNIQDSRLFKYSAFICIISLTFGSYFCFDTPAALPDKFKRDLGITTATFTDFYSWYNWPNVILCFFGGLLIDRVFGVRAGTILFSSLVLLGNLIFAIGALSKNITVMNIGRFIFGVGGENLCVAQNTYAVNWFIGKNLNFIFGIMFGICRLGSTLTLILLTPLYDELNKSLDGNKCLGTVLLIATSTCVLPLFGAFIMVFLDSIRVNATVKIDDQSISSSSQETKNKINLNNVFKFPPTFWLVLIITGTFYCGIFPFISVGKVFFISKYGFSPLLATSTNSIVYLISIVGFPFYGYIIDAVGRYSKLIIVAISGVMAAHFLLTFTFINPFVGVILMAVSYSLLSTSLWPMIALIVPKHQLGTAYGMMLSFQNISMAVVNILTGLIVEYKGFFVLEIFFLGILSIGLLSAFILFFIDSSRDGVLGISSKKRKLRQEQILNIQEYEVIE